MREIILPALILAAWGALQAQQVVAPTGEAVGPPRGEDKGNYNIANSAEIGYRWSLVGGNYGEYQSAVNYRNGLRLLSGAFSMDSKDGHGHYFDQLQFNTMGLGSDPYQSAVLRVQKNGLYRYDMGWRLTDYFNPGLTVAGGLHRMDTVRRMQDHEVLFFPQSKFRLRVGYSRNTQDGPALSTALELDSGGAGLPVFMNVRRLWNEYRIGGDVEFGGFRLTVLRRWSYFREDTNYGSYGVVSAVQLGALSDTTVLQQFVRTAPAHGRAPGWLGNLAANHKRWAVNARASYLSGHNDFTMGELAIGTGRFGANNRQILVNGNATRPVAAGDASFSLFPTTRLTIVQNISVNSQRISGPSSYTEISNGTNFGESLYFRYLGIRMMTTSTDAQYRANQWLGFYGGYHYTDRLVRTIEGFSLPATPNSGLSDTYENTNILKSGTAGIRVRPVKGLTASAEGEIGRADNPLTPVSDRNYHVLNGRLDYRTRKLQLSTSYKQFYNVNGSAFLTEFSSHSRNYSANGTWSAKGWFSLDAGYMKLHLDTVSGIAFFAGAPRASLQQGDSLYRSNVHAVNIGARAAIGKRADLYAGYTLTKDTGDGRQTAAPSGGTDPVATLLAGVQTFPLTYQSPLLRLSVRISPKLRWNAGYQFYNYGERFHVFAANQNFHANTGYTSVLWAF